ncbi:uncharacterized protein CLUP02_00810 [Colletotrichum lupini]|uniref:Uncharacterized protein n=1 Tax=Colletotrichum lupini TaxID=145971 RepID=A0A9Q8SCT3_9PEZI|nr:uncharacterized protein CLUP02_00810 [Colletotrichum lupini]UQC74162.1 hypothetical protein CLUP02_00810 [Colletotrichum lupini]
MRLSELLRPSFASFFGCDCSQISNNCFFLSVVYWVGSTRHLSNKLDALSGSRIQGTPILALSNYYRQQQTTCSPPPPALEPTNPSFTALVHARQRPLLPSDAVTRVRRPLDHSSIEIATPRDACCPAAQSTCYVSVPELAPVSNDPGLFSQQNRSQGPPPSSPDSDGRPPDLDAAASRNQCPTLPASTRSLCHDRPAPSAAAEQRTLFYVIDWSPFTPRGFSNINMPAAKRAVNLTWSNEPTMLLPAVLACGPVV